MACLHTAIVTLLGITQGYGMKFLSCRENCFQISYQGGIGKIFTWGTLASSVNDLPANVGDTGSIPGRIPHTAGRLSLCATTTGLQSVEPELPQ